MSTPILAARRRAAPSDGPTWIIGRSADLGFLIGGALLAYGLLAAHLFLGITAVTIYMAWILAIDGPHVFATLSRTYLDDEERAARRALLRGSLAFFLLGPATVGVSALVGTRLPYDVFLIVCTAWAYWHVVRQHYGVLMLYKGKAGETDPVDRAIDAGFLYAGLLAPIVGFTLHHERTLAMLGFDAPPPGADVAAAIGWAVVAGALLILAARQVAGWRSGRRVHWTKLAFLVAATSVSCVLFSPAAAARIQYEVVMPVVTSFHDVQYLAIVWFFHRNRMSGRAGTPVPFHVRHLWGFLAAGVLFTVAYRVGLGCAASAWPGCDLGAERVALPAGLTLSDLGVAFLWGFALHHYYLDQRIWHVSRDRAVRRDLRLPAAA